MGQLNDKMEEVSRNLVALHVKQVMNKHMQGNNKGTQFQLSDEEKENLKNLYCKLEEQVNAFVQQVFSQAEEDEEEEEERDQAKRTTLRDMVQKRRKKNKS